MRQQGVHEIVASKASVCSAHFSCRETTVLRVVPNVCQIILSRGPLMSLKSKIQACKDIFFMQFVKNKPPFRVMSIDETLSFISETHCSVSRFGDGELFMIANQMNKSFQTYDKSFAKRLKQVAEEPIDHHLICISDIFDGLSKYNKYAVEWFSYFLRRKKYLWYRYFDPAKVYGNAAVSRPYMDFIDKSASAGYFETWKKLWKGRDLLIVEGEFSRLGVGNDLFNGAKSVQRILCPAVNAYVRYEEILAAAEKWGRNKLVLLALGATATSLAYDLAKKGFWAIDIGHIDVEYEWMRIGATEKVPIPSKYVNEAKGGHCTDALSDAAYLDEIVEKIV